MTSLHAVAGARRGISAFNFENKQVFNPLTIREVNLVRDLAMLWSDELDQPGQDGLCVSWDAELDRLANQDILVIGYPHNLQFVQDTKLRVRLLKPLAPLGQLVDPAAQKLCLHPDETAEPRARRRDVELARSPVYPVTPGPRSLTTRARVRRGGLWRSDRGRVGIAWASPLVDQGWEPAAVGTRRVASSSPLLRSTTRLSRWR